VIFSDVQFSGQGKQCMKISMKVSMKDPHLQSHSHPQSHSSRQMLPCALTASAVAFFVSLIIVGRVLTALEVTFFFSLTTADPALTAAAEA
jgi:hypothetical protein